MFESTNSLCHNFCRISFFFSFCNGYLFLRIFFLIWDFLLSGASLPLAIIVGRIKSRKMHSCSMAWKQHRKQIWTQKWGATPRWKKIERKIRLSTTLYSLCFNGQTNQHFIVLALYFISTSSRTFNRTHSTHTLSPAHSPDYVLLFSSHKMFLLNAICWMQILYSFLYFDGKRFSRTDTQSP